MNFEELIASRDARKTSKIRLPYGFFYKRLIDGKYSNFVEFRDELSDNIVFANCVKSECEAVNSISDKRQLHFTPNEGGSEVFAVAVESGNYISFEQLLNESPSVVAQKDFINSTIQSLVALTSTLNQNGIFHVCFAPSTIFVRKNDSSVRLLFHGSFYQKLNMSDEIYEGYEDYVAPEVLSANTMSEQSDVYSLGKFIAYLYESSGLPFELRQVVSKATAEEPQSRYASVKELHSAMQRRQVLRRSATVGIAALLVALLFVGLFFDLLPNTEPVEFVRPVDDPVSEELIDDGFDPATELGPSSDSATIAAAIADFQYKDSDKIDARKIREFEAKAEQIFRKQFTKEADRILSKVYTPDKMNSDAKAFSATSNSAMKELVKKQEELTKSSSLSSETAQRIASEIIEQVTERKKAEMAKPSLGIQK